MSPELLKNMILLCPYFQNWAEVADLTDCSKVYHKVMSFSLMKGCQRLSITINQHA